MQKKLLMAGSAIGGFLLATTALTSTASAQALLVKDKGQDQNELLGGTIATERFGSTSSSSTTVGPLDFVYNFGSSAQNTSLTLGLVANIGAFSTTGAVGSRFSSAFAVVPSNSNLASGTPTATVSSSTSGALSVVGGLITVTFGIQNASAATAIEIDSIQLTQVQGLATAGTDLTLTATLYQGDNTSGTTVSTDTITLGTSADINGVSVGTATALVADATDSPPFSGFTSTSSSTAVIGRVLVTGSTALATNLSSTEAAGALLDTGTALTVSVTSDILAQDGLSSVSIAGPNSTTTSISLGAISTAGAFTAALDAGTALSAATATFAVSAVFDGSTAIEVAATAGTITATLAGTFSSAIASATGSTSTVSRNGISAEVNFFQGSGDSFGTTTFQSFLRISNSGSVEGAATISAVDGDGASIGTAYTTDRVPVNGQLQISNSDLETNLGITDGQSGQYTVFVTGPFQGYVQHVMLNNNTSAFTNLSGFRGNSGGNGNIIP